MYKRIDIATSTLVDRPIPLICEHIKFKDMTLGDALEHIVRDRLLRPR